MNIKTEVWNGHKIRFVEQEPGEWWAVAADVAESLGYAHTPHMARRLDEDEKDAVRLTDTIGRSNTLTIISESGIYEAAFGSEKAEAKEFKRWAKQILKTLRHASGLEAFQVFRMLDKEHQREAMRRLNAGLAKPVQVDFIKANTIANKAVSSKHGHAKMLKKDQMSSEMLLDRQPILEDTVGLMQVNDSFDLGLSVSKTVYEKYCH